MSWNLDQDLGDKKDFSQQYFVDDVDAAREEWYRLFLHYHEGIIFLNHNSDEILYRWKWKSSAGKNYIHSKTADDIKIIFFTLVKARWFIYNNGHNALMEVCPTKVTKLKEEEEGTQFQCL